MTVPLDRLRALPDHTKIAAALGCVLLFVPSVGVIQSALMVLLLIATVRLWHRRTQPLPDADDRSMIGRILVAMVVLAVGILLYMALPMRSVMWDQAFQTPEFYWVQFGGIAAIGAAIGALRGGASRRATMTAVTLGLLSTVVWVPIGRVLGVAEYVRFHPIALTALGGGALAFAAVDAVKRRSAPVSYQFFVFALVQSLSVMVYWGLAGETAAVLGYLPTDSELDSPDGRFHVTATRESNGTVLEIRDTETGDEVRLGKMYWVEGGPQLDWQDGKVVASWQNAPSFVTGGCEMAERGFFFDSQHSTTVYELCMESARPLLCLTPQRRVGTFCDANVQCESSLCREGKCSLSGIGETCTQDEFCEVGSCIGRKCQVPDGETCDSDRDCNDEVAKISGYCLRDKAVLFGKCYAGEIGDPCVGTGRGLCRDSSCVRSPGDKYATCQPNAWTGVSF